MSAPKTVQIRVDAPRSPKLRRLRLVVTDGVDRDRSWDSSNGSTVSIGTHASCDFVLTDPAVSRFHCEIVINHASATLRDCGSSNGTEVDGVRVLHAYLRHQSAIRLGNSVLQVHYGEGSATLSVSARDRFGDLIGHSMAMRSTFAMLERASAKDATVLLEGETGTGKSVSARAIHECGARAGKPFVLVECGSIPATLLESELFGHDKGAFTGASEARIGAFEEADGGTIVLDEIGELALDLQPKLLGVLETRQVRRIGSSVVRNVDVRVIAATNVDLRRAVNAGTFRADLYYRLAVLRIHQPALRDRPEDVSALAETILNKLGASAAQIRAILTDDLKSRLAQATWPGNIRELRNYLERCLVFEETLPLSGVMELPDEGPDARDASSPDLPLSEARDRAVRQFERDYLRRALAAHDGVVSRAAAAAGVDRTYFYRLLRRHQLRGK